MAGGRGRPAAAGHRRFPEIAPERGGTLAVVSLGASDLSPADGGTARLRPLRRPGRRAAAGSRGARRRPRISGEALPVFGLS